MGILVSAADYYGNILFPAYIYRNQKLKDKLKSQDLT